MVVRPRGGGGLHPIPAIATARCILGAAFLLLTVVVGVPALPSEPGEQISRTITNRHVMVVVPSTLAGALLLPVSRRWKVACALLAIVGFGLFRAFAPEWAWILWRYSAG